MAGWAEHADEVRGMCERLGVPLHDFYWAPDDEAWRSDVLRHAAEAAPLGDPEAGSEEARW